jgi:hypothetical protein
MPVRIQPWVELARSLGDRGLQPQPQPPYAIRCKARLFSRPGKAVSTRPGRGRSTAGGGWHAPGDTSRRAGPGAIKPAGILSPDQVDWDRHPPPD